MSKIKEFSDKYIRILRLNWESAIKNMTSFSMFYIAGVLGVVTLTMLMLKLTGVCPDLTTAMILSPIVVPLGISIAVLLMPFVAVVGIFLILFILSTYREIWMPLFVIMFVLKLLDLITLSWLVVTSPLWCIPAVLILIISIPVFIIGAPMIFVGASLITKSIIDTLFNKK